MGVLSVLWSALSQPNPNGSYHHSTGAVEVIDTDVKLKFIEAEALEAILGEISGDQIVEKAAERWIASIPDPTGFESKVADRIAEKYKVRERKAKNCKKKGGQ